ncbi:ComEC/Rec2 family competence protein [Dehalobacter sp. DCM]|uniref:ComEC/Rec2 family competence protein n=1 Tax=Dehalobacter sp. DCM TaxID=2907827 RepID=UPI00308195E5|nr:ComEC/Rec2 family competence protein [Dehalobacter sp. DCM]
MRRLLAQKWPDQAGVLEGILFGDASRISSEKLEMYKASGVMHVFAASGSNVAFIIVLGWRLFAGLPKRIRIIGTIGVIIFYAALCDYSPPILRATILGIIVLSGRLGKGKVAALRWLLLAAVILFLWNPLYLRDTGFQLSFAAAWGILTLAPLLERSPKLTFLPLILRPVTAVTLSAQIATLPILIACFHQLSLIGLITNIFILFLLGAVLQFGLIGTVLSFVPYISDFGSGVFYQAAIWLLLFADQLLSLCAGSPGAYFWVLNPGAAFYLLWYGAVAVVIVGKKKIAFIVIVLIKKAFRLACNGIDIFIAKFGSMTWLKKYGPISRVIINHRALISIRKIGCAPGREFWTKTGTILFLLIIVACLYLPSGDNRLEVTFLDVGQGDCILVRTSRETLLIDTGPKTAYSDAAKKIIVPYLMEKRINYLDMVFITHEDGDHIGGADYLLANIPVGKVLLPNVGERLENNAWQAGLPSEYLHDENKHDVLNAGDRLRFSTGLLIDVLAPVSVIQNTDADPNNNSLVLCLEHLGERILLTGDMEIEEMKTISDRGVEWDADYIKIPHHGGKSSFDTAWFDQTSPQAVFIMVGRNSFGHPSDEVLAYWQDRGIPVYRTDNNGTIKLIITKKGTQIICGRQ